MTSQSGTDEEHTPHEQTPDFSGGHSDNGQSQATTSSASRGDRKRAKQFIAAENEVLVDGVNQHYNQLFKRPNVYSTECKEAIWRKIADEVSAVGVTRRTAEVCRKRYNDCKSSVRKKLSLCNQNSNGTDGGPSMFVEFLPWENKIKEHLDPEVITGLALGLDTGSKSTISRFGLKSLQPNNRLKYSLTTGRPVHNRSCQTTHRRHHHHHFSSKYRKSAHRASITSVLDPKLGAQASTCYTESNMVTSKQDTIQTAIVTNLMKHDDEASNFLSQNSEVNMNTNMTSPSGTGEDCAPCEQTPDLSGEHRDNAQSQATTSASKGDRKRAKQFITAENEVLVDGVAQHYNQLFGRPNNCSTEYKEAIWRKIADEVSAVGVTRRTGEVCRKRYNDCKSSVRKKLSLCNQDTIGTDGGPPTFIEFLPWENKIKEYLDPEVISGLALGLDTGSKSTMSRFGHVSLQPTKRLKYSLATGRLDDVGTNVESTWIRQGEEASNFVSQSSEDNIHAGIETTWLKQGDEASTFVSQSSEDNVQAAIETTWIKQDEASNFVSQSSVEYVEVKQECIDTEDDTTQVTLDQYPQISQDNYTNIPPHLHTDTSEKWKTHISPTLASVDNAVMDLGLDIRACTEDRRTTVSDLDDVFSKTLNVFSNVIREEVGGVRSELTEVREILTDVASSHSRIANSFETITEILKDYMRTNHELLSTQKEILTALRTLEQTPITFPTPKNDMDSSSIITTSDSRFGSPSTTPGKRSRSQRNIKRTKRFMEQ